MSDLSDFTGWLDANHVAGVVGEVGWPGGPEAERWNDLARRWFAAADAAHVGVFVWGAAQAWSATYPLAVYRSGAGGQLVSGPQAPVVEEHVGRPASPSSPVSPASPAGGGAAGLRGVDLAGGSFGADLGDAGSYSAANPGRYGEDYTYPSSEFLGQLAAHGIHAVRLAVMWERLQPRLGQPLDDTEVGRVRTVLEDARRAGISVVLDLHNYGRFAGTGPDGRRQVWRLGDPQLPVRDLADLWSRLVGAFGDEPGLAAYDLMNEPHDLPGGAAAWEAATRIVVDAVRRLDARRTVLVPGYEWSHAAGWSTTHPRPWVDAPGVVYEAHQYFDADGSGTYRQSYPELTRVMSPGPCSVAS
ncbi:MAG: glycoside hydrolase family 5 protein [Motilibacteraceae bacterium]